MFNFINFVLVVNFVIFNFNIINSSVCCASVNSHAYDVIFTRQGKFLSVKNDFGKLYASREENASPEVARVFVARTTKEYLLVKVVRNTASTPLFINLTRSEDLHETTSASGTLLENNCFYGHGFVFEKLDKEKFLEVSNSWAAFTICQDYLEGFLLLKNIGFTLENHNLLAKNQKKKRNVDLGHLSKSFFNLTGDTFDSLQTADIVDVGHNGEFIPAPANLETSIVHNTPHLGSFEQPYNRSSLQDQKQGRRNNKANRVYTSHVQLDIDALESNFTKRRNRGVDSKRNNTSKTTTTTQLRSDYENSLIEQNDEDLGYFYDSAWKSVITKTRTHNFSKNPRRFLEIVIAVDESVIKFHGRVRVKQYVLTLMNIVNALYQDPSLEANLQIVIRDLHLFEKKRSVIKLGNAKKSLENVNLWNKELYKLYDDDDEPHDIALWLTRTDIGGPSGYAPVGGVCDPERSCALTRDEGLTCAFIIAHELAHILGLSHDGDSKNNNTCRDDALQGSVMAPMVSATFHHFLWSECSRKEFAAKVSQWQCLLNAPDAKRSIELNSTLGARFTMDEQCRVEFGEGYELCRSFDIVEPCAHLWCGHHKSPLVCKTKKGPPLEGTECGPHKWCIDGYCDSTLRINLDPLKYNPQDGGWSDWGTWTQCSRSCGLGMQFRQRSCDNPRPAYGGNDCEGLTEEWRVCNTQTCADLKDFRAQQCNRMPKLLDVPKNLTWLPYESDQIDLKCNYICQSKETGEIYASDEFLSDGTLCSYDRDNKRCVQGKCVTIGCDNRVNSTLIQDGCGVCNGDNSECLRIKSNITKKIKKQITRVGVLHNQARHIAIEFALLYDNPSAPRQIDFDLFLKDRKRNAFRIRKSAFGAPAGREFNQHRRGQSRENNAHPNDVPMEINQRVDQNTQDGISVTIVHGAKFRFHALETSNALLPQNETLYLSTQGPVLSELVLFIEVKQFKLSNNLRLKMNMEYLLHKKFKESRYEWILGGWGSCSTSCGGGKMFKTKACVEKSTQRIVARKMCSIVNKPPTEVRTCNDFSCNFVWIPGQWEPCTATCGNNGVQHREIYCVPQNLQNDTTDLESAPWKYMLPPTKCGYQPPSIIRPCNRTTCPGHWEYSPWSQCSTSCGFGEQIRVAQCTQPKSHFTASNQNDTNIKIECDSILQPPQMKQIQSCENVEKVDYARQPTEPCAKCTEDTSPFCEIQSLKRYCQIDSFRELCCHSCSLQHATSI